MKCFTFGKKVRRQIDDETNAASRVEILKKRFQRLTLLRQYFAINKRHQNRKFKYPVGEDALLMKGKPTQIYDEIQYCLESDVEKLEKPKDKRAEEQ